MQKMFWSAVAAAAALGGRRTRRELNVSLLKPSATGRLDAAVLNSAAVRKHTGEGEIAVVIPKRLLLDAARALL